jgi:hypothetical protein
MNRETQENSGLNRVDAASREFPEACYIQATRRGLYVDAWLLSSGHTL